MFPSTTSSVNILTANISDQRIGNLFGSGEMKATYTEGPFALTETGSSKSTLSFVGYTVSISTSYIDPHGIEVGRSYSKFNIIHSIESSPAIYTEYYKLDVTKEIKIGTSQTNLYIALTNNPLDSGTAETTYYDLENKIVGTSASRVRVERQGFPYAHLPNAYISTDYNNLKLFFQPTDPLPPFRIDKNIQEKLAEKDRLAAKQRYEERVKRMEQEEETKKYHAIAALTKFTNEIKLQIAAYESKRNSRQHESSQNRLDSTKRIENLLKEIASNNEIDNKFLVSVACVLNEIDLIQLDHNKQGVLNRMFTHSKLAANLEKAINKSEKDIAMQAFYHLTKSYYYLTNRERKKLLIDLFTKYYPSQPTAEKCQTIQRARQTVLL